MSHPPFPRAFVVQRDEDVSGVSGEGVVAEGVQFSDGWVATHWLDQPPMHEPKTDVWHNKGAAPFERVHGHGGRTRILWADEVAAARHELVDAVVQAFDLPAPILGPEAERAYLHRQIERALRGAALQVHTEYRPMMGLGSVPQATEIKGLLPELADAVMPVVEQLLKQRDRVWSATGRAYRLADRWEGAHGSANFLVRTAGVELREVLDADASVAPGTEATQATEPATCDAYQPATSAADSGLCARCGMFDYKHPAAELRQVPDDSGDRFGDVVHSEEKEQASEPPGVDESGLSCVCGDPIEWMDHVKRPGWVHSPGADTTCVIARPRCPECLQQHALIPGQPPACSAPVVNEGEEPDNEPDTVTDPAWLREQYMKAINAEHHRRYRERIVASPEVHSAAMADVVMSVRDRHLEQLRQRLTLSSRWRYHALGSNDRQACPYCTGAPQFLRSELDAHVQEKHARVLAVLASGGSLDERLVEPETRCRLPHEMEA